MIISWQHDQLCLYLSMLSELTVFDSPKASTSTSVKNPLGGPFDLGVKTEFTVKRQKPKIVLQICVVLSAMVLPSLDLVDIPSRSLSDSSLGKLYSG
jgi:hypothetical protein